MSTGLPPTQAKTADERLHELIRLAQENEVNIYSFSYSPTKEINPSRLPDMKDVIRVFKDKSGLEILTSSSSESIEATLIVESRNYLLSVNYKCNKTVSAK